MPKKFQFQRFRRLICSKCSPRRRRLGLAPSLVKTEHELSLTTYYPRLRYRCVECGTDRVVKIPVRGN